MKLLHLIIYIAVVTALAACQPSALKPSDAPVTLFPSGAYPNATYHDGHYYFVYQTDDRAHVTIYTADSPEQLPQGKHKEVWATDSLKHVWSPELHRINNRWYIYLEADDGNTDDHQLYVLENAADDPLEGQFQMKGVIQTNEEWNFGLHPTSIVVRGQQYLLWSGWQHRRAEAETQCIYIARMKNPWTLESQRVMISSPQYEWERQWINPDGLRTNYPIFVNENPEAFLSPDQRNVCVAYSASGLWTVYQTLGLLYARADDDLLNPEAWVKVAEPVFLPAEGDNTYGAANISVVSLADGDRHLLFYEAKYDATDGQHHREIRLKTLQWNEQSLPEFGHP